MPPRKWPYPGDSPIARTRKMALAYRAVAEQQRDALLKAAHILGKVDRRLTAFDDPAVLGEIDGLRTLIANTVAGVGDLDQRFSDWGEEWHAEIPLHHEEDDWITARQAAPLLDIAPNTVGRLRVEGRIKGIWDDSIGPRGGWRYRVADVWELSTKLRGRKWRGTNTTDSISDNGSSDPK